ncbi:hypothetical protein D3C76_1445950 [compost metagenome]
MKCIPGRLFHNDFAFLRSDPAANLPGREPFGIFFVFRMLDIYYRCSSRAGLPKQGNNPIHYLLPVIETHSRIREHCFLNINN